MILPVSVRTQYNDQRSPRSTPIVNFCSLKSSLPNTCTVLLFFIAGLLFLCLEHVFHRERIASRWRPAFSSHLIKVLLVEMNLAKLARSPLVGNIKSRPLQ